MPASFSKQHGEHRIAAVIGAAPWYENCYIVQHIPSGEQLVVDPGGSPERILDTVHANGGLLKGILLTHGHPDHLAAVRRLQEEIDGLPCRVHEEEAPLVANIVAYADALGLPVEAPLGFMPFPGQASFELGGVPFRIIHTPGHTPGGVVYAFDGFALTGDTLFNHGVGRTDLAGGDGRQLLSSVGRLLDILPGQTLLYCGHGPRWSVAEARPWWAAMRGWDAIV